MYHVDSIASAQVNMPDIFHKTVLVRVDTIILPPVIFSWTLYSPFIKIH
jgi:hypothetical protein